MTAMLASGWDAPLELYDQEYLASCLQVDQRTIRNYVDRGMPVAQPGRPPRYWLADCLAWKAYLDHLVHIYQRQNRLRPPPRLIDIGDAIEWRLRQERDCMPVGSEYVIVPLRHDHPRRANQLRIACEGLPSGPEGDYL